MRLPRQAHGADWPARHNQSLALFPTELRGSLFDLAALARVCLRATTHTTGRAGAAPRAHCRPLRRSAARGRHGPPPPRRASALPLSSGERASARDRPPPPRALARSLYSQPTRCLRCRGHTWATACGLRPVWPGCAEGCSSLVSPPMMIKLCGTDSAARCPSRPTARVDGRTATQEASARRGSSRQAGRRERWRAGEREAGPALWLLHGQAGGASSLRRKKDEAAQLTGGVAMLV